MMIEQQTLNLLMVVILATLLAIVWSLRYLVVMQRSMNRVEKHLEKLSRKILKDDEEILKDVRKELEAFIKNNFIFYFKVLIYFL